jgi:LPS export ABC transporter protein LptC
MIFQILYGYFSQASVLVIGALFILMTGNRCQPYEETTHKQSKGALEDSLFRFTESVDVDVAMYENGRRFVMIQSPFAKSHQSNGNNYTTFSGGVLIQLMDSLNLVQSEVQCSTATYDVDQQTFDFIGAVRVESENNRLLLTEKLLWFREDRHIETESFVSIFTERDTLYGYGLHSDESLQNYEIKKVSGNIIIE